MKALQYSSALGLYKTEYCFQTQQTLNLSCGSLHVDILHIHRESLLGHLYHDHKVQSLSAVKRNWSGYGLKHTSVHTNVQSESTLPLQLFIKEKLPFKANYVCF